LTVSEPDARPEARLLGVEVVVPVAQLGGEVAARVEAEDEPPPRGPAAPVRAVGGGGQGDVDLDLRVVADAELGLSVRREQAQAQRDDREGPAHDGGPSGRRGGGTPEGTRGSCTRLPGARRSEEHTSELQS